MAKTAVAVNTMVCKKCGVVFPLQHIYTFNLPHAMEWNLAPLCRSCSVVIAGPIGVVPVHVASKVLHYADHRRTIRNVWRKFLLDILPLGVCFLAGYLIGRLLWWW